jgi:hypothetical protein
VERRHELATAGTSSLNPSDLLVEMADPTLARPAMTGASVRPPTGHALFLFLFLFLHTSTAARGDRGCRPWDEDFEEEAQSLAGAQLLAEDAASRCARSGITVPVAAVVRLSRADPNPVAGGPPVSRTVR